MLECEVKVRIRQIHSDPRVESAWWQNLYLPRAHDGGVHGLDRHSLVHHILYIDLINPAAARKGRSSQKRKEHAR